MNLEVIERKVVAFATQYGTSNENTVKLILNYLENVRDVAFEKLNRNQLQLALYLLSKCLGFVTPKESAFCCKFLTIKIDVANKLMYLLSSYRKREDRKLHRQQLETGLAFMASFLEECEKQPDYARLLADPCNFLETSYVFAGKFHRKCGQLSNAIRQYERALQVIAAKLKELDQRKDSPDAETHSRLTVLRINCLYKLSKCHRGDSLELQQSLEQQATAEARLHNSELFLHISRKVREHHEKQNFKNVLERLDNKRKIECEVMRLIEASKHSDASLYNYFGE